jgi:hypothetical protein
MSTVWVGIVVIVTPAHLSRGVTIPTVRLAVLSASIRRISITVVVSRAFLTLFVLESTAFLPLMVAHSVRTVVTALLTLMILEISPFMALIVWRTIFVRLCVRLAAANGQKSRRKPRHHYHMLPSEFAF